MADARDYLRAAFRTHATRQNTERTKRDTINFGYDFNKLMQDDGDFVPFPEPIAKLRHEAVNQMRLISGEPLPAATEFVNGIASLYQSGFMLQPHVDVDHARKIRNGRPINFHFGPYIIGVILEADTNMQGRLFIQMTPELQPAFNPEKALFLDEKPGLCYVMYGENRHKYPHGVSQVETRRLSFTLRTVIRNPQLS